MNGASDHDAAGRSLTRREALAAGLAAAGGMLAATPTRDAVAAGIQSAVTRPGRQFAPRTSAASRQAADIIELAREALTTNDLKAVIVRVTIDGEDVVTDALGESMPGVPATPDMHFRNGAVAISYMATLLLQLVDREVVALDDTLDAWLPDLPDADRVTLGMLANMTAGYPDYVPNEDFVRAIYEDPFRQWTSQELIEIGLSTPRVFDPGTNWDYSHTNYVILGDAFEQITGQPLATLLQDEILTPLDLRNTRQDATAAIPDPVLHSFSSERRAALGIDPAVPFYEESTFWSPSWTLPAGAVQTSNIYDLTATAVAVGEGTLLSPASHQAQVDPGLVGFGSPLAGCPSCHTLDEAYSYGLGVVLSGPWILQNPLLGGYGMVEAYLPEQKIAVAVVTTFGEAAFDAEGNNTHGRASWEIFAAIAASLAPEYAPSSTRP